MKLSVGCVFVHFEHSMWSEKKFNSISDWALSICHIHWAHIYRQSLVNGIRRWFEWNVRFNVKIKKRIQSTVVRNILFYQWLISGNDNLIMMQLIRYILSGNIALSCNSAKILTRAQLSVQSVVALKNFQSKKVRKKDEKVAKRNVFIDIFFFLLFPIETSSTLKKHHEILPTSWNNEQKFTFQCW